MNDLYDSDILTWSDRQAALLRRVADGERINDQVDWENVIEEVASVGREQLHAAELLLVQALVHMLKAQAWPLARDAPHWRAEARRARGDAAARFVPSMQQHFSLAQLYRRALVAIPETNGGQLPIPLPPECRMTLAELLAED